MKIIANAENAQVRKSAVRGSRNSIFGEVYEKILPALPSFPYSPKDMVFIGKWVDYLIFDWLSEWVLREIVFLELKSGNAVLNKNERLIQEALRKKQVRFSEYRINSVQNKD